MPVFEQGLTTNTKREVEVVIAFTLRTVPRFCLADSTIVGCIDQRYRGTNRVGTLVGSCEGSIAVMAELNASADAPVSHWVPCQMQARIKIYKECGTNQFVVDIVGLIVVQAIITDTRAQGVVGLPVSRTEEGT